MRQIFTWDYHQFDRALISYEQIVSLLHQYRAMMVNDLQYDLVVVNLSMIYEHFFVIVNFFCHQHSHP